MHADALPKADSIRNIVVLGMGGSGISGDVVAAAFNDELPVPISGAEADAHAGVRRAEHARVRHVVLGWHRGDALDGAQRGREGRAARRDLVRRRARAHRARRRAVCTLPCPPGYLPRAAIGALVAPLCTVLFRMGLAPGAHAMLMRAQTQLATRRDQCRPEVEGAANPARELARQIGRTIPLIYGGGAIGAVAAYRWKCDVNENAKAPAFWHAYPELDHNEICAWGQHGDVTRQLITLVELRHGFEHERLRLRFDATREIIDECVHQVLSVDAEGEGRLAPAARPHVRGRLDELLPRAAERRRSRPDRRDLRVEGPHGRA